jgi:hypothetical protein
MEETTFQEDSDLYLNPRGTGIFKETAKWALFPVNFRFCWCRVLWSY